MDVSIPVQLQATQEKRRFFGSGRNQTDKVLDKTGPTKKRVQPQLPEAP